VRQEAAAAAERLERKRAELSALREDLAGTRQLLAKQEALTRDRWAGMSRQLATGRWG
jgi:hypothetical protein